MKTITNLSYKLRFFTFISSLSLFINYSDNPENLPRETPDHSLEFKIQEDR